MEPANPHPDARYCPNCHYPMRKEAPFCSECGQKFTTGRITIWQLLRDFIGAIFDIDSRIFRTLRAILSPGKLTTEYFKGRHRRYVHPARLFLFTALIHFAILGLVFVEIREALSETMEKRKREVHRDSFLMELDSIRAEVLAEYPGNTPVGPALDTLRSRMGSSVSSDSVVTFYFDPESKKIEKKGVATQDVYDMRTDALLDKCGIDGAIPRFQAGQVFRILKEGGNFLGFMLGNLIWLVALMMPALALLLKLLYIRRKKYFVEHLIFSFHYHAFAFLVFSAALLLDVAFIPSGTENAPRGIGGQFLPFAMLAVLIYMFIAMRRVYGQGYVKTLIKFCIVNFSYVFIFSLSLILTLLGGALLF